MFGFLFKILLFAGIVVGIGYFVVMKKGLPIPGGLTKSNATEAVSKLPLNKDAIMDIKNMNAGQVLAQVSGALDNLVTHQSGGAGPVVLGVKVSNDSVSTLVDVLQSLPAEQVQQIRAAFCASPSGN